MFRGNARLISDFRPGNKPPLLVLGSASFAHFVFEPGHFIFESHSRYVRLFIVEVYAFKWCNFSLRYFANNKV